MSSTGVGLPRQSGLYLRGQSAVYDYDYVKIPVLAQHDIPCYTSSALRICAAEHDGGGEDIYSGAAQSP